MRWIGRVLGRYDNRKRPKLTAWISVAIIGVIVLSGILGYAVPAFLSRGS